MRLTWKAFEGAKKNTVRDQAAEFATTIGRHNVQSITEATAGGTELLGLLARYIVTVWYWVD